MPEGDTIHRAARKLHRCLAGEVLEHVEIRRRTARAPAVGACLEAVQARGKHLLMPTSDGLVLHTHMSMDGSWHLYRHGERWREPGHTARVVLRVPSWEAVCFAAPTVEVLTLDELTHHPALSSLGPDLCREDADIDEALRRLADVDPSTLVGDALLDQRIAAGAGNVYRCEVLWHFRLPPEATIGDLDPEQRRRVWATTSRMLRANLDGGPRRTVPGGLAVYGRSGRPCRRCGTPIVLERSGRDDRVLYRCPRCQAG